MNTRGKCKQFVGNMYKTTGKREKGIKTNRDAPKPPLDAIQGPPSRVRKGQQGETLCRRQNRQYNLQIQGKDKIWLGRHGAQVQKCGNEIKRT